MSNTELGKDCCGDRYECNTSTRCECGCGLCYCRSCYMAHAVQFMERTIKERAVVLFSKGELLSCS